MMRAASGFMVLSIGLHFLAFSLFWREPAFERGVAGNAPLQVTAGVVAVNIVAGGAAQASAPVLRIAAASGSPARPGRPTANDSAKPPQPSASAPRLSDSVTSSPEALPETGHVAGIAMESPIPGDFFPPGRLTRLPVPLSDIDLNEAGMDEVAMPGSMELTLLIEADGTVASAEAGAIDEAARIYAERVAQRFRNARFSPGELDGKAVRSSLKIMVISESLSAADSD